MTRQRFVPDDTMPLREALRGLRFLLHRGAELVVGTFTPETLPKPASDIAQVVLREVGGLARSVDGIVSDVARTMVGGAPAEPAPLRDLIDSPRSAARFGAALYVALTTVLDRLGARTVFVSEAAARGAFARIAPPKPDAAVARQAAILTLHLLDARVIRGTTAQQAALVPGAALEPVSLFAVILWLQSERGGPDSDAGLAAATDMAVARCVEIAEAVAARDLDRIAALYTRYAPHV